jgi:FkbM family methyltransferase
MGTRRPARSLRRMVNRLGIDIGRYPTWGSTEWTLDKLLPQLNIDCVIDVGGHFGEYGQMLRRIGYAGKIVSFEPVSKNFQILSQVSAQDLEWQVHQLALGSTEGETSINVTRSTDFASILMPDESHADHFAGDMAVEHIERVQMSTLENVITQIPSLARASNIFLKTDTQGFDMEVIEGMGHKSEGLLGLQAELPIIHLYEDMSDFVTTYSRILELGFEIFGLSPVAHDSRFRTTEYDCVFRRVNN